MKKLLKTVLTAAALANDFAISATLPARAQVEIDVNKGDVQPLPVAIPDFSPASARRRHRPGDRREPAALGPVRAARSGGLHREGPATPRPAALRRLEDDQRPGPGQRPGHRVDGRLRVDFRLWDIFAEQQLLGLQFTSSPENGGAWPTRSPTRSMSG